MSSRITPPPTRRWNAGLPAAERLGRDELELDPDLRALLEREAAGRVEEARRELLWESERRRLRLAKLRAAFLDPVAVPRIVVTALR